MHSLSRVGRSVVQTSSSISSAFIAKRGLRTHFGADGAPDPARPELFAATGIVPPVAFLTTAREQAGKYGQNVHRKVGYVNHGDWLDIVDKRHLSNPWGQKASDFPLKVQRLIADANPGLDIKEDKLLTWGNMTNLKQYTLQKIEEEFGVDIINGQIVASGVHQTDTGIFVPVALEGAGKPSKTIEFHLPKDTFLYYMVSTFRKPFDAPCPSHTELYTLPEDKLPKKVLVVGVGLSAAWLARDFPGIDFIFLKRPQDSPAFSPLTEDWTKRPNVQILDASRDDILISDSGLASVRGSEPLPIYAATGTMRVMPSFQEGKHPCFKEACIASSEPEPFAGTKNIPLGSFPYALCQYMQKTENPHPVIGPITYKTFCRNVVEYCQSKGLTIPDDKHQAFFASYQEQMGKLDHAPESGKEIVNLLLASYKSIEATPSSICKFELIVDRLVDNYLKDDLGLTVTPSSPGL